MLSLFPNLLSYQFFAITLIRLAAALAILYMSYRYAFERGEIERASFWPVGHIPRWLTLVGSCIVFIVGILLVIGLYTQAAAIAGMILALKDLVFVHKYPRIMPLSAGASALLFVMCLALLLSGAGAFAVDLPL